MAAEKANNLFDWCNTLAYAKTNYSDAECLELFKKSVFRYNDIDSGYVSAVQKLELKNVNFINVYSPVYLLQIKATYVTEDFEIDENVKTTTTYTDTYTFGKSTYRGMPELNLDEFVGRNDNRLFILSHVDDLKYPLYNQQCVYTRSEMKIRAENLARPEHFGVCTLNCFDSDAVFIPVVCVKVRFGGKEYFCSINKHNGYVYNYYPVSQKAAEIVKKAFKQYKALKIAGFVTIGITALTLIFIAFNFNFLNTALCILFFGGADALLIWQMGEHSVLDKNLNQHHNEYRAKGKISVKSNIGIALFLIIAIIIEIVLLVSVVI